MYFVWTTASFIFINTLFFLENIYTKDHWNIVQRYRDWNWQITRPSGNIDCNTVKHIRILSQTSLESWTRLHICQRHYAAAADFEAIRLCQKRVIHDICQFSTKVRKGFEMGLNHWKFNFFTMYWLFKYL